MFIVVSLPLLGRSRPASQADAPVVDPTNLVVEPPTLTMIAGHDAWLAAQANDTSGQPIGGSVFGFTATDARVLRVSSAGHVIALGPAIARTFISVASGRKVQQIPVEVLSGPVSRLERVSGDRQSLRAGRPSAALLSVRVSDLWNNPVPSALLRMVPGANEFPSADEVSKADGTAGFSLPTLAHSGNFAVSIQSAQDPRIATEFHLSVQPGPAAAIDEISAPVSPGPANDATEVHLRVTDAYGNPIAGLAIQGLMARRRAGRLVAQTDAAGMVTLQVPRERSARKAKLIVSVAEAPAVKREIVIQFPRAQTSRVAKSTH